MRCKLLLLIQTAFKSQQRFAPGAFKLRPLRGKPTERLRARYGLCLRFFGQRGRASLVYPDVKTGTGKETLALPSIAHRVCNRSAECKRVQVVALFSRFQPESRLFFSDCINQPINENATIRARKDSNPNMLQLLM
jgi:hypothetical protein